MNRAATGVRAAGFQTAAMVVEISGDKGIRAIPGNASWPTLPEMQAWPIPAATAANIISSRSISRTMRGSKPASRHRSAKKQWVWPARRGLQMPPLATKLRDDASYELIRTRIRGG